MAADKVTPETINASSLWTWADLCTCNGATTSGINPMVPENRESHKTDFTVSVDAAKGITTGIVHTTSRHHKDLKRS